MKLIRSAVVLLLVAALVGTAGIQHVTGQDKAKDAKAQDKDKDTKAKDDKAKDKDKDAKGQAVFELYKDRAGEFRFRLKDAEGELLAASGSGYKTKADCQAVIDAIKKEAAKAKVDDQSK
jgi:uncharacterized protein